jgi:nucleotide-binding universal stress UspA family protein
MVTKPVVVGVDGSEESLLAAEWAAMEADRHGRPLRIVSAPATVPRMHGYQTSPAAEAGALHGVSARVLGTAVTRAGEVAPGLAIGTGLLSGTPAVAVAGSGTDAALLVVGACGAGGFAAMVLGSVSRYAAIRATCPVVVVRQGNMAVHQAVAVGIRDPEDASDALTFAFEEAAARHADLMVVHAWHWTMSPPNSQAAPEGAMQASAQLGEAPAEAAHRLSATLDIWCRKYPGVRVRYEIVRGHPGRVLADYSSRADLVVIGRHGKSGIGSILHPLLNHAHGPVAIVPSVS